MLMTKTFCQRYLDAAVTGFYHIWEHMICVT